MSLRLKVRPGIKTKKCRGGMYLVESINSAPFMLLNKCCLLNTGELSGGGRSVGLTQLLLHRLNYMDLLCLR